MRENVGFLARYFEKNPTPPGAPKRLVGSISNTCTEHTSNRHKQGVIRRDRNLRATLHAQAEEQRSKREENAASVEADAKTEPVLTESG